MTGRSGGPKALSFARMAISYEIGMWRSLYRWVARRPHVPGEDPAAFGYAAIVTPVIAVFIFVSAIEVPALHLLLPWETPRRIALTIGVYSLLWMVGMLASIRTLPHVVDNRGLRVRYSVTVDIMIPWSAIASVQAQRRAPLPGRKVQVEEIPGGRRLNVAVQQTDVDVVLREPTTVSLSRHRAETIIELRFHADDPVALVERAHERLTSHRLHAEKPRSKER